MWNIYKILIITLSLFIATTMRITLLTIKFYCSTCKRHFYFLPNLFSEVIGRVFLYFVAHPNGFITSKKKEDKKIITWLSIAKYCIGRSINRSIVCHAYKNKYANIYTFLLRCLKKATLFNCFAIYRGCMDNIKLSHPFLYVYFMEEEFMWCNFSFSKYY